MNMGGDTHKTFPPTHAFYLYMFRRTSIPNLQFTVASSTQVESFIDPHQESSIRISYEHQEGPSSDAEMGLGKSTDGEIVQLAFSSTPAKTQSFNLIYRF